MNQFHFWKQNENHNYKFYCIYLPSALSKEMFRNFILFCPYSLYDFQSFAHCFDMQPESQSLYVFSFVLISYSFYSWLYITPSHHHFSLIFFLFLFSSLSIFFTSCVFSHIHFPLSSSPLLFSVSRENTENIGFSVRQSKYSMFKKVRRSSRYYTLILSRKTQRSHNTQNKGE